MLRLTCVLCLLLGCLTACFAADAPVTTAAGKVLGPDGKPVAGADVLLVSSDQREHQVLHTDANGMFSTQVGAPAEGQNVLARMLVRAKGLGLYGGDVLRDTARNVITLPAARELAGTVVDAAGKPVAGLAISMAWLNIPVEHDVILINQLYDWQHDYSTHSDAQGHWAITGLPNNGTISVAIADPRFARWQENFNLVSDDLSPRFTAYLSSTLTGRVIGLDGKPAANLVVVAYPTTGGSGGGDQTDANGAFNITNLQPGSYFFHLNDSSDAGVVEYVTASVKEGETTTVPDVKLKPGALIEGSLLDGDNEKPVANVRIRCADSTSTSGSITDVEMRTDEQGHFRLRVLPGKRYIHILFPPSPYLPDDAPVEVDAVEGAMPPLTLHLHKGLTLSGTMVDDQDKPIPGMRLVVRSNQYGILHGLTADANGAFQKAGYPAGQCRLEIADEYIAPTDWESVQPQKLTLPVTAPVKIVFRKCLPTTLTGRIVTTAGKPVDGAKVTLNLSLDPDRFNRTNVLTTDADGRYALAGVKPNTLVIVKQVEKTGYLLRTPGTLQRHDDDIAMSDTVIDACAGVLNGRVVDEQGKPVSGAQVMTLEGGIGNSAVSDAAGNFTLNGVPDGPISLYTAHDRAAGTLQAVAGDKPVTLTLKPAAKLEALDATQLEGMVTDLQPRRESHAAGHAADEPCLRCRLQKSGAGVPARPCLWQGR